MTTQKSGHEWRFSIVLIALMVTAFMLVSSAAAADTGAKFKGFGGTGPYPVANFSTNVTPNSGNDVSGTAPFTVQLYNNSTSTTPITAFEWTLSDGRVINNENPVVTFNTPGTYSVILKVTNATGWMSNISGDKPVNNADYTMPKIIVEAPTGVPVFDFTPGDGNLPLDFPITFTATQTGGQTPTTWVWNWGDGTATSNGAEVTHTFTGSHHADHIVTLTGTNAAGSVTVSHTYTLETLAKPTAGFAANKSTDPVSPAKSGVAPLAVGFTDASTGNVATYAWDFGGAGTSALKDPAFVFTNTGDYNVTLTVSNTAGSSTAFHWVNVTGPTKPAVLFKAVGSNDQTAWGQNTIPGTAALSYSSPYTVAFTDYSVNYSQEQEPANSFGVPTSWLWDFGDGQTSSTRNVTHTYSVVGTYTVRLTATNSGGSNSSYTKVEVTTPDVPAAKLAINNTEVPSGNVYSASQILTGETVNFGSISTGNPTTYKWVFSDNPSVTYSTDRNTTKSFATAGDYFVILTVTNGAGSSTSTGYFTVSSSPSGNAPVAAFWMNNTAGGDKQVDADGVTFGSPLVKPALVNLTNLSTNAPTSYQWFIDGALVSTDAFYQYTFTTAGMHTIVFRATNAFGSGQRSTTVEVAEPGAIPVANWEVDPASGTAPAPATVTFTDTSTNSPTSWFWNFDDGQTSTLQSPVHTFTQPGNYSVTLIATNSKGSSIPVQKVYQVKTLEAPDAKFEASSATAVASPKTSDDPEIEGPIPFTVNFTSTSTMNPTSVLWQITGTGVSFTRTTNSFNYTFDTPGKYNVQLTAYNAAGQDVVYKTAFVNVTAAAPAPDFTWTPTSPVKGQPVQFTDTTLYGPTGWSWSFGDGGLSSAQNPSHTYANAGTFTVTLTTWNSVNGAKTVSKTITVADLAPPVANFTWSPEEPKVGDLVNFTDSSTNNPTSWTWVIENTQYNVQNPAVTFTTPGVKIAFLIATNAAGSSAAKLVQINVAEAPVTVTPTPEVPIVADFTMDQSSGVAPLAVQFVSTSTGPYTSLDWTILLGEDVVDTMVGETPSFTFANPGTYTVLLEASNSGTGEVATKEQTVTVTATPTTTVTTTVTTTAIGGNQPFPSAHVMPGRLEAEDYDITAGYPAYSDTTAANEGGAYRQDAVDIEVGGSNYNVGWIRPTEFLTYSVDVPTDMGGAYTIAFRMANPSGAKSFNVYVDGVSVGTVNLPATGSFNTWTTVQTPSFQMTGGRHVIKVDFPSTTSINFDYMDIQGGAPVTTTTTVVTTTTTAQPTTGGATFTAAPIPVKKSSAIKFTVTPAPGKTIKSAWWTFDKAGHYNTWNSRTINPTFYYPAVGTYTPLVILTYTDGTTQTVEKAGYVQVIA